MLHLLVSVDITSRVVIGLLAKMVLGVAPDLVGNRVIHKACPHPMHHFKVDTNKSLKLAFVTTKTKPARSHSPLPEIAVDLIIENPHFEVASLDVAT